MNVFNQELLYYFLQIVETLFSFIIIAINVIVDTKMRDKKNLVHLQQLCLHLQLNNLSKNDIVKKSYVK